MDIEERKRVITSYIKDHPDCKAEEIVQGVSGDMSRALVFRYLPELIKEKIVLDNSKNRRDHKLSINNTNLILKVQNEIDNFKKVFFHLIQKSEIFAKNKNYSIISNEIGLSAEEPKKWTNSDYQKYVLNLLEMVVKGKEVLRKNKSLLDENLRRINNLQKTLEDSSPENKPIDINKIIWILDELVASYNQRIAIIDNNLFSFKKFISLYDVFIILRDTLSIFQYVVELFFYKSIIWACTIPKEMLSKLNDFTFNSFMEIQNRLTKYLSHIFADFKVSNILEIFLQELKRTKKIEIFAEDQDDIFYYEYKIMNLENEIKNVIASLLPMCKETKKYGIPSPKLTNKEENFFAKEDILKHLAFLKDLQQRLTSLKLELYTI